MHKFFAKTQFLGKKVIFLPQCHSTNEVAMSLVSHGHAKEGMVVITADQTAGKGQRGNQWLSEPGKNLTFSIIVKPSFIPLDQQFKLHMLVSLGVFDALQEYVPNLSVKWPNDIYVGDQKLGGILIENTVRKGQIDYSVLGIGINVNQNEFDLSLATSLYHVNQDELDIDRVAEAILIGIENYYSQTMEGKDLKGLYESKMYQRGLEKNYRDEKGKFSGKIKGVNEEGQLLIWDQECLRTYNFKEVSFLD